MKKFLSLILVFILSMSLMTPAMAATTPKYTEEAETLYELGLFKGTGTNADGTPIFSLENNCTRLQALIILTRLLGLEDEALATTEPNPFTDIDNSGVGAKYAAYAYSTGLTNGIGGGKFGNTNVTPAQFVTFVLRALGYDDSKGDFKISTAIEKGREIGLISDDLTISGNTLLRDECVKINYNALKTEIKNSDKVLAEKLIEDGTLTEFNVQNSEILAETVYMSYDKGSRSFTGKELLAVFPEAKYVGCHRNDTVTKEMYKEGDFSPLRLLINNRQIVNYCSGDSDPFHEVNNSATFNLDIPKGITVITILNKDKHLIGYCVTYPGFNEEKLPFKTCDLDGTAQIEKLKKEAAFIAKNNSKFNENLVYIEKTITVDKTGKETSVARLRVDKENLPDSMKDFKYYSVQNGGEDLSVSGSWYNASIYYFANSENYSNIIPYDKEVTAFSLYMRGGGIVILYNENKEVVGYTRISDTIPTKEIVN